MSGPLLQERLKPGEHFIGDEGRQALDEHVEAP